MQRSICLLLLCLAALSLSGQNPFYSYFNGRFHQIVRLQADSIYSASSILTDEATFEYDASHRITRSRSRVILLNPNTEIIHNFNWIYYPNKRVFLDTTHWITTPPTTNIYRRTSDSLDGRIICDLGEPWNGTAWQGGQRDSFFYDAALNQVEHSTQSWDDFSMEWRDYGFQRFEYDAQGRILIRRELQVGGSITDTTQYNENIYTYNTNGKLESIIWKNGSPPINSNKETYVYDSNGNLDSIIAFNWNIVPQTWDPTSNITLDDSPEQQSIKRGKTYKLNNQLQWYLDTDAFYTTGPHIYTDEPSEILTKKFNINTNQLENHERQSITYTEFPNGLIKQDFQRANFTSGNWQNTYRAEAWMRKTENVGVKTPEADPAPSCGLPNPVAIDDLPLFLPEIVPAQQLEIFSMDGRLVLNQGLSNNFLPDNGMEQPGVYWLVLRDETRVICAQKVILH